MLVRNFNIYIYIYIYKVFKVAFFSLFLNATNLHIQSKISYFTKAPPGKYT